VNWHSHISFLISGSFSKFHYSLNSAWIPSKFKIWLSEYDGLVLTNIELMITVLCISLWTHTFFSCSFPRHNVTFVTLLMILLISSNMSNPQYAEMLVDLKQHINRLVPNRSVHLSLDCWTGWLLYWGMSKNLLKWKTPSALVIVPSISDWRRGHCVSSFQSSSLPQSSDCHHLWPGYWGSDMLLSSSTEKVVIVTCHRLGARWKYSGIFFLACSQTYAKDCIWISKCASFEWELQVRIVKQGFSSLQN
jgi:hypothetical protein